MLEGVAKFFLALTSSIAQHLQQSVIVNHRSSYSDAINQVALFPKQQHQHQLSLLYYFRSNQTPRVQC